MMTNLFRLVLLALATLVLAPRTESQSSKPQNKEKQLTTITNGYMHQMLAKTKNYTIVILKPTDKPKEPGADSIILGTWAQEFRSSRGQLALDESTRILEQFRIQQMEMSTTMLSGQ